MAAAGEHQRLGRTVQVLGEAADVGRDVGRGQIDPAVGVQHNLLGAGHHRAEVDAVGVVLELLQRQTVGVLAVAVAPRARSHRQVVQAIRSRFGRGGQRGLRVDPREAGQVREVAVVDGGHMSVLGRHPRADGAQPQQDLPLVGPAVGGREQRRRPLGRGAGGPSPQQLVTVGLLQRGEAGQDHVGVARSLVEGVVERDHGVELGQGRVETAGVGGRDHRVAADDHQRLDLAGPGRVDLLGQARHRELAQGLWSAPHPAVPAAETLGLAPVLLGRGHGHRLGPHQPSHRVEVAGEGADHVGQPRRQGAELLVAGADAGVPGGPVGGRELAGQRADRLRGCAAGVGHPFGREARGDTTDLVHPLEPFGEMSEAHAALCEQHVDHRELQQGIGAGPHRQPLVGMLDRPGAAGVDHHHLAPLADPVQRGRHVGMGQQAALAGVGVGPLHHHEVGALDVGSRDAPGLPVHELADHVLGPLVHRPRRVDRRQPGKAHEEPHVAADGVVVGRRVAHIGSDGLHAVGGADPTDELGAAGEGLVPAGLGKVPRRVAHQRHAQPVTVGVKVPEGGALGADVPLGPHVGAVGPDQLHLPAGVVHLQPAHGLAQRAGPYVDAAIRHVNSPGHRRHGHNAHNTQAAARRPSE